MLFLANSLMKRPKLVPWFKLACSEEETCGRRLSERTSLLHLFHPIPNYTGCIYCTSYVILLPFNIYLLHSPLLCTTCCFHSSQLLYIAIPPYIYFLDFLDRGAVVLYILCKYNVSHLTRSQNPCWCKPTWPINVILILIISDT